MSMLNSNPLTNFNTTNNNEKIYTPTERIFAIIQIIN